MGIPFHRGGLPSFRALGRCLAEKSKDHLQLEQTRQEKPVPEAMHWLGIDGFRRYSGWYGFVELEQCTNDSRSHS